MTAIVGIILKSSHTRDIEKFLSETIMGRVEETDSSLKLTSLSQRL